MASVPFVSAIYGVATSICVLCMLSILVRGILLTDLVSPTAEHTDSFECGYNAADFTSSDLLDIRTLISLYLIFDTELWFLILAATLTQSSFLVLGFVTLVYLVYTALELYIIV